MIPTPTDIHSDGSEPERSPARGPKPKMDSRAIREDGAWYIRISATSGGMEDPGVVLGQLPDSKDGFDQRDLEKLAPYGKRYLSLLFPREEWGEEAWAYASDFRALDKNPSGEWAFAVYVSDDVEEVTLRFTGPESILEKAKLRQAGVRGKAAGIDGDDFTFQPTPGFNYFTLRIGGK